MFDIDASLPAEIVPLSWLLGVWEGTGVIAYQVGDDVREHEFGQRVAFTQDGGAHVQYACSTWLLGGDSDPHRTLFSEIGYWRLSRPLGVADPGPGMLPGVGDPVFTTAEAVETLRNAAGSFDLEVTILQPGGVSELYLGTVDGPRIDLGTDAVVRSSTAKEYAAATRLYGLVDDHLLWAWDIAALGQDLRTHASGRLARVE
ncbi:FABP family protein [Pseudolysinimonas sp.]|uniref:FABP family protein n=1 Tax=Pseudolysinimonas sp. TaxID=2680009 RepID=UPI00286B5C17|nr:FABP family protein [Pseudolysinimonas sp.]